MQTTPKSLRLQMAIVGRTNVGKSSFLNLLAGQDVAITSPEPGTTTDVVEKPMELLPIGPVVFLDTAGLDDDSRLGEQRVRKTDRIFDRADVILLVCDGAGWGEYEQSVMDRAKRLNTPVIGILNKADQHTDSPIAAQAFARAGAPMLSCSSTDTRQRDTVLNALKQALVGICPDEFLQPPPLMGDLVRPGRMAVLIVPVDLQAPKGRLILPQVQAIRDALDHDAATVVVKEHQYTQVLAALKDPPDIVICDSQVVLRMTAETPAHIPCTTFSILMARLKGDLDAFVRGAAAVDRLRTGDRILIAESCSHHATEDDIGRVKIPRWLRQYTGLELTFDTCAGRDFPEDLARYALIVQCGGCMLNRREILTRIGRAQEAGVPITNYGVCIAKAQGVLARVLSPIPTVPHIHEGETPHDPHNHR